jgi:hypothetical protein
MVKKCIIDGCRAETHLLSFPKDVAVKRQWCEKLLLDIDIVNKPHYPVCSKHLSGISGRTILKRGALPLGLQQQEQKATNGVVVITKTWTRNYVFSFSHRGKMSQISVSLPAIKTKTFLKQPSFVSETYHFPTMRWSPACLRPSKCYHFPTSPARRPKLFQFVKSFDDPLKKAFVFPLPIQFPI